MSGSGRARGARVDWDAGAARAAPRRATLRRGKFEKNVRYACQDVGALRDR